MVTVNILEAFLCVIYCSFAFGELKLLEGSAQDYFFYCKR